jgi:mono/diheme cytochrome c family protein
MNRFLSGIALVLVTGCRGGSPHGFTEPQKLGGKLVAASVLTEGERDYIVYCGACHGERGDGKGPAAAGLRPPPRDFTSATFKFAAVPGGTLPHDDDLRRIVREGLAGTAMLPWDGVPEKNLDAILDYIKTLSPRWQEEELGDALVATPDPWKAEPQRGVERGEKLYHGLAQCSGCHPAYLPKAAIDAVQRELTGSGAGDFRADLYGSVLKDSDYGVKILPPDFATAELRSVRARHRLEDLYRVIAAGVGGTAMPTWKGSLPEADLWAIAHYVEHLMSLGRGGAAALRRNNELADASWKPPATH